LIFQHQIKGALVRQARQIVGQSVFQIALESDGAQEKRRNSLADRFYQRDGFLSKAFSRFA
jgi:hypothetical protein